jgi:hypothetical protein
VETSVKARFCGYPIPFAGLVCSLTLGAFGLNVLAQQPAPSAGTARAQAPIDLTGTWVSVVTEDWRFRMVTPPKGDYASVPLTPEGRKVADTWDLAKDEAAGLQCKPYGVGNVMRMPGRVRISWDNDTTLKIETDAGTQTRLLRFDKSSAGGERTWQGHSAAEWVVPAAAAARGGGGGGGGRGGGGRAAAAPGRGAPRGGSLKVVTTQMREGYLRKNGVPYTENAIVTEYFDRLPAQPNGDIWLIVQTRVEDPRFLTEPFLTSTHFKLEPNEAKWNPTPCKTDPPPLIKK